MTSKDLTPYFIYRTEKHDERSVSCNDNKGWRREKPEFSLILSSQCSFVKVEEIT
jgi:hypothetical protein